MKCQQEEEIWCPSSYREVVLLLKTWSLPLRNAESAQGRQPFAPAHPTSVSTPSLPQPLLGSEGHSKQILGNCLARQLTCVKAEHSSHSALRGDHPALTLAVGRGGPPVGQQDLKQPPAALHWRHHGVPRCPSCRS